MPQVWIANLANRLTTCNEHSAFTESFCHTHMGPTNDECDCENVHAGDFRRTYIRR